MFQRIFPGLVVCFFCLKRCSGEPEIKIPYHYHYHKYSFEEVLLEISFI